MVYLYQNRSIIIYLQDLTETNIGRLYYLFQTEFKEYEKRIEGLKITKLPRKDLPYHFSQRSHPKKDTIHRERFHELCSKGYHRINVFGDVIITKAGITRSGFLHNLFA